MRLKNQNCSSYLFISLDLLARKNNRFKGAIRIFVTPKNDGIDIILPEVNKEMKDEFFLNLLSHIYIPSVPPEADKTEYRIQSTE